MRRRWFPKPKRLRELSKKEKRTFDRIWLWVGFIHLSVVILFCEFGLWYQPRQIAQAINFELCIADECQSPALTPAPRAIPPASANSLMPLSDTEQRSERSTPVIARTGSDRDAATSPATSAQPHAGNRPDLGLDWIIPKSGSNLPGITESLGPANTNSANDQNRGWGWAYGNNPSRLIAAGHAAGAASGTTSGSSDDIVKETTAEGTRSALFAGSTLFSNLFGKHDVAVIIDKSGSMAEEDCPNGVSRWQWCREQTADVAAAASEYGNMNGLTITLFSDDFSTYRHAYLKEVGDIFRAHEPSGATFTGRALRNQLEEYFRCPTKPLVIAVITDGVPSDPAAVRDAIITATKLMRSPDEVKITILQIGDDPRGSHFASMLDNALVSQGARFDIVQTKPFSQLRQMGVVGALVDVVAGGTSKMSMTEKNGREL